MDKLISKVEEIKNNGIETELKPFHHFQSFYKVSQPPGIFPIVKN